MSSRASRRGMVTVALALAAACGSRTSLAGPLDRGTAEAHAEAALIDGHYGFCASPRKPLSRKAVELCPIAPSIQGCDGFAKACDDAKKPIEPPGWWSKTLARLLAYFGMGTALLLAVTVVVAIIASIVWALLRGRREDKRDEERSPAPVHGILPAPAVETATTIDVDVLMRMAAELAAAGRFDLALFTYLSAALRALDDRGAIRIARHRTHGEYVRECRDGAARPGLREIVRDVDLVLFGGNPATLAAVERAAERARTIASAPATAMPSLGAVVTMIALVLGVGGCGGLRDLASSSDPGGDDLVLDLLVRQGATARHLTGSLATLPMDGATGPAVVVDTDMTPMDEPTRAHVASWVAQGGALVLAGEPESWPKEFWATLDRASGERERREVVVRTPCPPDDDACASPRIDRIHVAKDTAMSWPHDGRLAASAAFDSGELYAAVRPYKKGVVLGLASDDLLTNAGLSVKGNPSGLIALLESLDKSDFVIARPGSGVAPPSNPFAGLVRIGLGLALVHVLVFTAILFVGVGTRHARPVPEPPPRRRAFSEHVRATAGLYARARASGHALHAYARYVDQQLRARAPRGTGPAQFLAHRSGAEAKDTANLYARAMAARADDPPSEDDLLVLRRLSLLFAKAVSER